MHKANILKETCGLFIETARKIASRYPTIKYDELHVDAAAYKLLNSPQDLDIIVTTNMFGDILSDEAAGVYFTEKGVWCEWDNSTECEHVKYALEIPKVREILRKHGWEVEEGKLKKKKMVKCFEVGLVCFSVYCLDNSYGYNSAT